MGISREISEIALNNVLQGMEASFWRSSTGTPPPRCAALRSAAACSRPRLCNCCVWCWGRVTPP